MRRLFTTLLTLPLALPVVGCAETYEIGHTAQPIVGGTPSKRDPSVLLIAIDAPRGYFQWCTGSLVSPHVLLTAAHCFHPEVLEGQQVKFAVFLGDDLTDSTQKVASNFVPIAKTYYDEQFQPGHPDRGHDVAAVVTATPLDRALLPVNHTALEALDQAAPLVGATIRAVGFGRTAASDKTGATAGVRREVLATLGSYNDSLIYWGDRKASGCAGDSGGPTLLSIDGTETIIGVTSGGSVDCSGGFNTRVDKYAASFLDPIIAEHDPPPAAMDSGPPVGADGGDAAAPSGGCSTAGGAGDGALDVFLAFVLSVLARRRRGSARPRK